MKLTKIASAIIISAAAMSIPAVAGNGTRVGGYDFTYAAAGEMRAQPVQVFDNGSSTYFQFRSGMPVPAIFGQNANGTTSLLIPVQEGPYIRVDGVYGQFVLQLGAARANVLHAGGTRMDAPEIKVVTPTGMAGTYMGGPVAPANKVMASLQVPAAPALVDDQREHYSYATPIKGDKVKWEEDETIVQDNLVWFVSGKSSLGPLGRKTVKEIAAKAPRGARFIVVGQFDDTMTEKMEEERAAALRSELVSNGVQLANITIKYGQKGTTQNKLWSSIIQIESDANTLKPRGAQADDTAAVADDIQSLIKRGVLSYEQGQAILRRKGLAAAAAAVAAASQPPAVEFQMRASDKSLQGMFRRWAEASGYQLVWDAPESLDPAISGDATIKASSLTQALDRVMADVKAKGYAIDLTIYSNKVVRVTPAKPAAANPNVPASDRTEPAPRINTARRA